MTIHAKTVEQLWKILIIFMKGDCELSNINFRKTKKYTEKIKLKKTLIKKNKSYKALAKILGISVDAVFNKLNGYTSFSTLEIAKISKLFNFSPEQIKDFFLNENI